MTILYITAAIIAAWFVYWLFEGNGYYNPYYASMTPLRVIRVFLATIFRVLWFTIKVAAYAFVGFLIWFCLVVAFSPNYRKAVPSVGTGEETEQLAGFVNGVTAIPQMIWGGFVTVLQILVIASMLLYEKSKVFYSTHVNECIMAVIAIWVVYTVFAFWKSWDKEFEWKPTVDQIVDRPLPS